MLLYKLLNDSLKKYCNFLIILKKCIFSLLMKIIYFYYVF